MLSVCTTYDPDRPRSRYQVLLTTPDGVSRRLTPWQAQECALSMLDVCATADTMLAASRQAQQLGITGKEMIAGFATSLVNRIPRPRHDTGPFKLAIALGTDRRSGDLAAVIKISAGAWEQDQLEPADLTRFAHQLLACAMCIPAEDALYDLFMTGLDMEPGVARKAVWHMTALRDAPGADQPPAEQPAQVRVESTGEHVLVDAKKRHLPGLNAEPGKHLFIIATCFRVANPAADDEPFLLDTENLLSAEGPACWVCEQLWTPGMQDTPCPGDPADAAAR